MKVYFTGPGYDEKAVSGTYSLDSQAVLPHWGVYIMFAKDSNVVYIPANRLYAPYQWALKLQNNTIHRSLTQYVNDGWEAVGVYVLPQEMTEEEFCAIDPVAFPDLASEIWAARYRLDPYFWSK